MNGGLGVKVPVHDAAGQTTAFFVRYQDRVHGYLNRCAHVGVELDWEGSFFTRTGDLSCARATAPPTSPTPACAWAAPKNGRLTALDAGTRRRGLLAFYRQDPPAGRRLSAGRPWPPDGWCAVPGSGPYGEAGSRPAASDPPPPRPCRRRFPVGIAPRQHRADHQLHLVEDHQGSTTMPICDVPNSTVASGMPEASDFFEPQNTSVISFSLDRPSRRAPRW